MANATQWEYNNENLARRDQAGFRVARGLPAKGSFADPGPGKGKGRGKAKGRIKDTYTHNAPGWSQQLVDVEKTRGAGNTHAIQNAAECAPYYGMTVDIGQGPLVTLPTAATAVARTGDWDILPNPVISGFTGGGPKAGGKSKVRRKKAAK